jgi:hypothetical protein
MTIAEAKLKIGDRFNTVGPHGTGSGTWEVIEIVERGVVVEYAWPQYPPNGKWSHGGHRHLEEWPTVIERV